MNKVFRDFGAVGVSGVNKIDAKLYGALEHGNGVIVVGRFALKFARNARGRASNLYEAKLYRSVKATRRALLCPVLWVSRNGAVQIMRAAKPMADMMKKMSSMGMGDPRGSGRRR